MKPALSNKEIRALPPHHGRSARRPPAGQRDPARVQGGNWVMQGLRRSGHVHDEDECQMSIAEFMGLTERVDDVE
jgi:hypothetical protein